MAAEQIVKWHILYPAWDWYTGVAPQKSAYICHHPFGQYWVPAVFLWIFGSHDFVVHLPAALMSTAVPPMLYGIAREKWGPRAWSGRRGGLRRRAGGRGVLGLHEPGDVGLLFDGGTEPHREAGREPDPWLTWEWRVHLGQDATSLVPRATQDRDMAWAPSLPTKLWRPGFIYRTETILNHRIGWEPYLGHWATRDGSAAPRRLDHHAETSLAIVE
jgi:hypothetical protein